MSRLSFCRSAIVSWLLAVMVVPLPGQTATKEAWAPLQFLAGKWTGAGSGEPGSSGTGGSDFTFELGRRILVRKNWATYPPGPGRKTGIRHEDLMVVYPEGSNLRAIYFDNEGHVIHYTVSFPVKQPAVTFESEASQPGPRYRLTYELDAGGRLTVVFFIAPPGQPFTEYGRGILHRTK